MSSTRFFNGSRSSGSGRASNPVTDIIKMEIQKKGKLPANVRYKYILKKRMEAKREAEGHAGKLPGSTIEKYKGFLNKNMGNIGKQTGVVRSKRANEALKQIAMKKAAKEAKALRQMVVVQPRNFSNGRIAKNGRIYDVADNIIGQVNTKNGKIAAMNGWSIGKYKPGSIQTNLAIQDAINKYSPYYINLRKMQAMQQGALVTEDTINLYGHSASGQAQPTLSDYYGSDVSGPRQNIGVTAWGAMSNNAWGTFTDNAWGTSSDNAWGTVSTDVWGGISAGGLWGVKGTQIWGTGSGKNYLKGITNFMAALFGLSTKGTRDAKREFLRQHRAVNRGGGSASAPRASARR